MRLNLITVQTSSQEHAPKPRRLPPVGLLTPTILASTGCPLCWAAGFYHFLRYPNILYAKRSIIS